MRGLRGALALLCLAFLGCSRKHLGPKYGAAYRAAFTAQAEEHEAEPPAPADAHDAKQVLARHRGAAAVKSPGTTGGVAPSPASGTASAGQEGDASGNPNPIRIEAR